MKSIIRKVLVLIVWISWVGPICPTAYAVTHFETVAWKARKARYANAMSMVVLGGTALAVNSLRSDFDKALEYAVPNPNTLFIAKTGQYYFENGLKMLADQGLKDIRDRIFSVEPSDTGQVTGESVSQTSRKTSRKVSELPVKYATRKRARLASYEGDDSPSEKAQKAE